VTDEQPPRRARKLSEAFAQANPNTIVSAAASEALVRAWQPHTIAATAALQPTLANLARMVAAMQPSTRLSHIAGQIAQPALAATQPTVASYAQAMAARMQPVVAAYVRSIDSVSRSNNIIDLINATASKTSAVQDMLSALSDGTKWTSTLDALNSTKWAQIAAVQWEPPPAWVAVPAARPVENTATITPTVTDPAPVPEPRPNDDRRLRPLVAYAVFAILFYIDLDVTTRTILGADAWHEVQGEVATILALVGLFRALDQANRR
jgi:hypothetical protein